MIRDEILEYPYQGTITRIVEGKGDEDDTVQIVYDGLMDEHQTTDDEGRILQTASYIISIPLIKDSSDSYIVPRKGDEVELDRYGETMKFVVDNAEPSQIGGISVYVTRKIWD